MISIPTPEGGDGRWMYVGPSPASIWRRLVNKPPYEAKTKGNSKAKAKFASCNIVSASSREADSDVVPFLNSKDEDEILYSA